MILAQTIVTYIYYIITAIIGITLLKKFFSLLRSISRKT